LLLVVEFPSFVMCRVDEKQYWLDSVRGRKIIEEESPEYGLNHSGSQV
jgi:hypothetical protein